jgi:hypothetical protein
MTTTKLAFSLAGTYLAIIIITFIIFFTSLKIDTDNFALTFGLYLMTYGPLVFGGLAVLMALTIIGLYIWSKIRNK